jgi:hypothetical protein
MDVGKERKRRKPARKVNAWVDFSTATSEFGGHDDFMYPMIRSQLLYLRVLLLGRVIARP